MISRSVRDRSASARSTARNANAANVSLLRSNADCMAGERTRSRNRITVVASGRLWVGARFCHSKRCAILIASIITRSELMGALRVRQPKRLFRLLPAAFERPRDLLVPLGHLCKAVLSQTPRPHPVPLWRLLAALLAIVLGRHRLPPRGSGGAGCVPSGRSLGGALPRLSAHENAAQGMGIRAPTERGSEIPRGDLGVGECRRYARGRLRWYALHRRAASKGCLLTFRQPFGINVRASGAASTRSGQCRPLSPSGRVGTPQPNHRNCPSL